MIGLRSFRSRVFVVLLAMALLPAAAAVAVGTLAVRELGTTVGTLGPWDAVASSGQRLADAATDAAPGDTTLARLAREHREVLSNSLRRSRLWSLVSDRALTLLPVLALVTALLLGGTALLVARWLSRGLTRPIRELVEWTELIGRGEPVPEPRGPGARTPEFAVLRASLRTMSEELLEARRREVEAARLRAWTEMARRVAHELKNPLTPMRMAATTLARSEDPATSEPATVLLEEIGRLDEMARTFSQPGRMPDGPPSEIDVEEMARTLADRHGEEGEIRVSRRGDVPRIHGHHELLRRALRNLLVNAREAVAQPASTDVIEVELSSLDGDVVIRVLDRGPGIPAELLEEIWLPDVSTKKQGTGLGLAIVRQAARAHDGVALARNRPGGGAEFELRIPVRDEPMRDEPGRDEPGLDELDREEPADGDVYRGREGGG